MTNTAQPQPTAALSDAELIDALIAEVRRAYYPYLTGGHEFAERIYTLGKELESRRLARAESAPGVTLDTRRVFDMAVALTDAHIRVEAIGDQRTLEPCTCPDCLFALEFIEAHDAALADAGTEAE